jgi:putative oxidoreductase
MFPLYFLYDIWAVLALRIAVGAVLIVHGWPKLRNLRQNAKNFDGMGFRPGILFGTIAAILEVFGGAAVILGIGVTWISILLMLQFLVILPWRIAKRHPFSHGWELDLLMLAGAFVLFSLGAGAFSLDRIFFGIL